MSYPELLARSCYSLLQGASTPEELLQMASSAGVSHLGLVDRDGVYGLVRAYTSAQQVGCQLICGATLTIQGRPPVSLLVENTEGWANLCHLITLARKEQEKGFACVPVGEVAAHAKGLTCVLRYGWTAEDAGILRESFGTHLEVVLSQELLGTDRQRARWAMGLSKDLECAYLVSNDVLFHRPHRKPLADILTCIRRKTTLDKGGRFLLANNERHLLSEAIFLERYGDFPKGIKRAREVASRCSFVLDTLEYQYPREVVPEGETPIQWLRTCVFRELMVRYPGGVPWGVQEQIQRELKIIHQLEYSSYFLTVYDVVKFARSRGILCQGRGSAANSAVCYALGITSVDPACSNLLFERFVSPERDEPPDIDVDFEHARREEVIQYIYTRYGRDRAAIVNEFISYRLRSAIRDVGKVFGLSLEQVEGLSKALREGDEDRDSKIKEAGASPESPIIQNTLKYAKMLRGFPRHVSIHVGGFVISEDVLTNCVPIEPARMQERTVIQWDKYDIEALGFVKVDVLGLGILTCIHKAFDLIALHHDRLLTLANIPGGDTEVFDMFCQADTVGVFQIESRAQMSMLPRLKPRCFYDLVIEVALVRPGPIQGGMVHPYLRRRNGEEPIHYAHPALQPILERTLGVPLFQEQVMAMAVAVGGFTPGEADQLRRAMGAWKKQGSLGPLGKKLVEGMVQKGIEPEYAGSIFKQIQGFGSYGFPESHAASFARLVYVSGWLKKHYPAVFSASLINSQPMGFYSPRSIVADVQRHGVEVHPVCVQHSHWECTVESKDGVDVLRLGFCMLRGFGHRTGSQITGVRPTEGFTSIADLAHQTGLLLKDLLILAKGNAFACFDSNRRHAAWVVQGLWTHLPLFSTDQRKSSPPPLPPEGPMEALQLDYQTQGLSLTLHPIGMWRTELNDRGILPIKDLWTCPSSISVEIVGIVSTRQRPKTASGVVFMTLEDETGMVNTILWPKQWSTYRRVVLSHTMLRVRGKLQRKELAVSVLAEEVRPFSTLLEEENENFIKKLQALPIGSRDFH